MTEPRAPSGLRFDQDLYREVLVHLATVAPLEGVGLLAVVAEGEVDRATRFYSGTNLDASPARYTMDPAEVLAAFQDIDANGWRLGAIVHSHPATPPTPSPTDLREAYYPESLLLIVGLAGSSPLARAWRLVLGDRGQAVGSVEVPVLVDGASPPRASSGSARRTESATGPQQEAG